MKNTLKAFGIIAIAALIGFSFAACKTDTTDEGETIFTELQNTVWIHTAGHKLEFKTTTVIATKSGETAKTYKCIKASSKTMYLAFEADDGSEGSLHFDSKGGISVTQKSFNFEPESFGNSLMYDWTKQ